MEQKDPHVTVAGASPTTKSCPFSSMPFAKQNLTTIALVGNNKILLGLVLDVNFKQNCLKK